jgi:hypothetical protein
MAKIRQLLRRMFDHRFLKTHLALSVDQERLLDPTQLARLADIVIERIEHDPPTFIEA